MIWLVPSNLKLIDRSTRYIRDLAGVVVRGRLPDALRGHRVRGAAAARGQGLPGAGRGRHHAPAPRAEPRGGRGAARRGAGLTPERQAPRGGGSVKQNVAPRPGPSDSAQARPPWASTIRRTRARPTPVPSAPGPASRRGRTPARGSAARCLARCPGRRRPARLRPDGRRSRPGARPLARELRGVLHEVLEDLEQPAPVRPDDRQVGRDLHGDRPGSRSGP